MTKLSRSEQLEKDLQAVRDVYNEAVLNEDSQRITATMRIILQTEVAIAKLKKDEGETLDAKQISELVGQIININSKTAKEFLDEEQYALFVDALRERCNEVWELDEQRSLPTDETQREPGDDSPSSERNI